MCGIAGILNIKNAGASGTGMERIQLFTSLMSERGPDGGGHYEGNGFILGHRRLKIIDLSDRASQPMIDEELGLGLVFNGAIYNYRELKRHLQGAGYSFFSDSDTEVIIKAYHHWGEDFLQHMNGMFAICLVDLSSGKAILARDRLGIKPLYYSDVEGEVIFGSSLTALVKASGIKPSINRRALNCYLNFHAVIPAPDTIFSEVQKLPPAGYMTVEPDGTREIREYWSLDFRTPPGKQGYSVDDWLEELDVAMKLAVQRRLVADVPVGVLLSGGLDSSLITALLAHEGADGLETFSIGFESAGGESGNEFQYSDLVARHFNTRHHKLEISGQGTLNALQAAIFAMNEPMVSHDNVGFFLLSKEVAKYVKVVQSGQGADEVFAGYHWYPPMQGSKDPVGSYREAFFDRDFDEYLETVNPKYQYDDYAGEFVSNRFSLPGAEDPVDKALRLDMTVMLVDDPVKRVDSQTMAWGLEARVPFLDHELVELAAQMPAQIKLDEGGKGILKTLARKYLPHDVIDRPKGYFPVPALKYLNGPVLEFVRDSLSSRQALERGLFKTSYLERLFENPEGEITRLGGSKLWQLGLLEMWFQQHGF